MSADEYLREVAFALRDLPWSQRRDLLADLRDHLAELPPETNLLARLGTPEHYTAELRAAAGLHQQRGAIAWFRSVRPRSLILFAAGLAALVLAIAAIVIHVEHNNWLDNYQPIVKAYLTQYPPGSHGVIGSNQQEVMFREGAPFAVGVQVLNRSNYPVRLLGVSHPYWPVKARLFVSGPRVNDGGATPANRLFHPFDLPPGHTALLAIRGTYHARCKPAPKTGGFFVIGNVPVRYSFLSRTRTAQVPLGDGDVQITFPKGMDCLG